MRRAFFLRKEDLSNSTSLTKRASKIKVVNYVHEIKVVNYVHERIHFGCKWLFIKCLVLLRSFFSYYVCLASSGWAECCDKWVKKGDERYSEGPMNSSGSAFLPSTKRFKEPFKLLRPFDSFPFFFALAFTLSLSSFWDCKKFWNSFSVCRLSSVISPFWAWGKKNKWQTKNQRVVKNKIVRERRKERRKERKKERKKETIRRFSTRDLLFWMALEIFFICLLASISTSRFSSGQINNLETRITPSLLVDGGGGGLVWTKLKIWLSGKQRKGTCVEGSRVWDFKFSGSAWLASTKFLDWFTNEDIIRWLWSFSERIKGC